MKAPCGIEIKVGQVWHLGGPVYGSDYVVDRCHGNFVTFEKESWQYIAPRAHLRDFTNKRGGYMLVEEAPCGTQR